MRMPMVCGNWKMNNGGADGVRLARAIAEQIGNPSVIGIVVCPPFTNLAAVQTVIEGTIIELGGQNLYPEPHGAFTGEISGAMLAEQGCRYVIVGHSERRMLLGESNALAGRKVLAALSAGLIPILCVGESLVDREAGHTWPVIEAQLAEGLQPVIDQPEFQTVEILIAYEPVWAIGTGKTATPSEAQNVHASIRRWLHTHRGADMAAQTRILYGGSVKPESAAALIAQADVDGALVGGASLDADSFSKIAVSVSNFVIS